MAVITGDLYKGFTFGGISSKAYGVYITQEASFDAPEKDVETFEIAGRNGSYILDNGRFRNISVSYKCGIAESTETDFATAIRRFRSALSSLAGKYVRLTDDYNANEYREAAFFGGFSVEKEDRRAGEFTVTFDAKPQRFLTSGETAIRVTSGGTVINPTLFESKPLLQVWGYGDITINGDVITVNDEPIGTVNVSTRRRIDATGTGTTKTAEDIVNIASVPLNTGDAITLSAFLVNYGISFVTLPSQTYTGIANVEVSAEGDTNYLKASIKRYSAADYSIIVEGTTYDIILNKGTDFNASAEFTVNITLTRANDTEELVPIIITAEIDYSVDTITVRGTLQRRNVYQLYQGMHLMTPIITAQSTKGSLGEPLYFDLDIGEAYKEEDGAIVGVNNAVSFPAELPTLKAGGNVITYDNTITRLDVVPRWWEV